MDKVFKEEKRLVRFTYILIAVCFMNLAIIKESIDYAALVMGAVIMVLIGYTHFILRKYFPKGDKYLYIFTCILSTIGLTMLYRLDTELAIKQIIWFILGVTVYIFIIVLLPKMSDLKKYRYLFLSLSLVFMSMSLLFGKSLYGAKNWVSIAGFSFQPSEIGKVLLVIYLAIALADYTDVHLGALKKANFSQKIKYLFSEYRRTLVEPAIVVMISLGCMVLQRDLGTALMIFGVSVTMLYMASGKLKYVITTMGLFVIGGVISYNLFYHVQRRVMIWADPWPYVYNESYQLVQGMYGMAEGGILGTGLGLGYPEFVAVNESDFIFAAITEEMGILVGFAIILIYFLMFYRSMRAALTITDKFSKIVDVGLSTMIATQALVIVGGVTGAIPLTGITLPFVSYGGTSMLSAFATLGLLQKISEGDR